MENTKTNWDLGLLYQDENDPQIAADIAKAEAGYEAFAKKYAGREDFLQDEQLLLEALTDYENLRKLPIAKPYAYFSYRLSLNSKDKAAESRVNLQEEQYVKTANKVIFFELALMKIAKERQIAYVKSGILKNYHYFLQEIFKRADHALSEPEEKILSVMGLPSYSLWVKGNEKIVSNQEIIWKGKKLPINSAIDTVYSLPKKDRDKLGSLINERLKNISDFAESELNAVVINKKIEDGFRKYLKPYSSTILSYQNDEATVDNLVAVVTKHFPIAHRFYKIKAKMLGLKKLGYWDRNAAIGKKSKEIPFPKGVDIVKKSFGKFDQEYADIFQQFLDNGQIDVFPKTGKRGGAFCSHYDNQPIFVFLNYVKDFHSVTTMAHEMGHAFHSHFSTKNQPPVYQHYSIAAAEVASTLFENFAFDEVFSSLSKQEQIIALHDKINSSVNTIFRQIACFNFEVELHTTIREKGSLPKEELAKLMNKHLGSYLGSMIKMQPNDGYTFVYWSHLRYFFYVYSYAFGELVSNGLYEMYKQDNNFKDKIRQFLSAGGSDSPENIFKSIGIDVRKPDFFEKGLKKIEDDIKKLEKLIA